jgi:hypothetical protein
VSFVPQMAFRRPVFQDSRHVFVTVARAVFVAGRGYSDAAEVVSVAMPIAWSRRPLDAREH